MANSSACLRDVGQQGVLPNGIKGLIKLSPFYHTIPTKTAWIRNLERDSGGFYWKEETFKAVTAQIIVKLSMNQLEGLLTWNIYMNQPPGLWGSDHCCSKSLNPKLCCALVLSSAPAGFRDRGARSTEHGWAGSKWGVLGRGFAPEVHQEVWVISSAQKFWWLQVDQILW